MTSFAFIFGIFPLVNATGAGAAARRSLGTAVFGGMLAATLLAVFFVPVFYVAMQRLRELRQPRKDAPPAERPRSAPREKSAPVTLEHAAPHP
jgi:HAE1 family hydrophobic/amphiphilic exporter-1